MGDTAREFRNSTDGHIGAVRLRKNGEEIGVSVAPGDSVFLTPEEEQATANAPRRPENNPFAGDSPALVLVEGGRPVGRPTGGEETGAAAAPAGPAPEGEFSEGEEPGTPDAPAQTPRGELGNITPDGGKVTVPQGGVG